MFLGVCSGIARSLGWDPTIVRVICVLFGIGSLGATVLIYFILAFIMPE